jgi:hypothetical protein
MAPSLFAAIVPTLAMYLRSFYLPTGAADVLATANDETYADQ